MYRKNLDPVFDILLDSDLDLIKSDLKCFDHQYNRVMGDHPIYQLLQKWPKQNYRDLKLIWKD